MKYLSSNTRVPIRIPILKLISWLLICLAAFTNSCIDKIELSVEGGVELPFVNGYLTNNLEYQKVILAKLIPFSNQKNPPISGADVFISDSEGNKYEFEEKDGEYISKIKFEAVEEVEYTLFIELDGHQFVSTPQKLSVGQSIESFSFREDTIAVFDELRNKPREIEGIMLTIDMENSFSSKKYYKYSINYTYEFQAYRLPEGDPFKVCYYTMPTERFRFILHENQYGGYPLDLKFIEFSRVFEHGLSVQLTQYSMTEEVFRFWQEVKKINENTGSIFDTPPYTINGNMTSQNSKKEMRGMFGIYSVDSKRIFLTQDEVSYSYPPTRSLDECFPPRPFGPPPYCWNCMASQFASLKTNIKPDWWPQ